METIAQRIQTAITLAYKVASGVNIKNLINKIIPVAPNLEVTSYLEHKRIAKRNFFLSYYFVFPIFCEISAYLSFPVPGLYLNETSEEGDSLEQHNSTTE